MARRAVPRSSSNRAWPGRGGGSAPSCRSRPRDLLLIVPVIAFMVVGCSLCIAPAEASDLMDFDVGDFRYWVTGDHEVILSHCYADNDSHGHGHTHSGDVVVPATVTYNGTTYKVVGIGGDDVDGFNECEVLTSIVISEGVETIGKNALAECPNLVSVVIPSTVDEVVESSLAYCPKLTTITVDSSNEDYCSVDNVLFTKDMTALVQYSCGASATGYQIPSTVTTIWEEAFAESPNLVSVTIPDSVTTIRNAAFNECTALTSVTIPSSVTNFYGAFTDCPQLSSVTVLCPEVGEYGFVRCTSIKTICFGEGVGTISSNAFCGEDTAYCTKFYKEDGVTEIDPETQIEEFRGKTFTGNIEKMVRSSSHTTPDDSPIWSDDDDWYPSYNPGTDSEDMNRKSDDSNDILLIVACIATFMAILTVFTYSYKR